MNKHDIIQIFKKLGFSTTIIENYNEVVEMSAMDAFVFSSIVGSKYLLYENGITMKGRSEVFIHRGSLSNGYLIYSPGLFSRNIDGLLTEGNSSFVLSDKYPEVFNDKKYVIVCDIKEGTRSNVEKNVYNKLKVLGLNPNNYIVYKNYSSNNIGETLQEYFSSLYFNRKGYLTENQVPWFQQNFKYKGNILQGGIPDFCAFHCDMSNYLFKLGIIDKQRGVPITILPVISNFTILNEKPNSTSSYKYELLIGEAKTDASSLPQAMKQLDKYSSVELADTLFTIIPNSDSNPSYDSLYIKDHNVIFKNNHYFRNDKEQREIDGKWLDTYIKMLLLGNVRFNNILKFIDDFRTKNNLPKLAKYEAVHLLDAVQETHNDEFYSFIKENLCHTQVI